MIIYCWDMRNMKKMKNIFVDWYKAIKKIEAVFMN